MSSTITMVSPTGRRYRLREPRHAVVYVRPDQTIEPRRGPTELCEVPEDGTPCPHGWTCEPSREMP